jgi:hypothetical protein
MAHQSPPALNNQISENRPQRPESVDVARAVAPILTP